MRIGETVFIALPFIFLILLTVYFKKASLKINWREALIFAYLSFGLTILISTEILSIFKGLSFPPVVIFWSLCTFLAMMINICSPLKGDLKIPIVKDLSVTEKTLLTIITCIALMTCAISLIVPPNTWDAMTYHMGRVVHWIQNKSLTFYPTSIDRQLYINPFAEYWITHFQILSKGDRFANLVQWLSAAGTLLGVSLIGKVMGLGRKGQILCAFFAATLPNFIVQSTSTQTDMVGALWTTAAVYFLLKNIAQLNWQNTLAVSAAFILALYAKGTTAFILTPFLIWIIWHLICSLRLRSKQFLPHLAILALAVAIGLGSMFIRNLIELKSPVYPGLIDSAMLPLSEVKGILSNWTLHYTMHLRMGIPHIDNITEKAVEFLHHLLGMTVLTSPANCLKLPFNYQDFPFNEDQVPNFMFCITLTLIAVCHIFLRKSSQLLPLLRIYLLCVCAALLLFNGLAKWSPFNGRYHVPFFILCAPLLAHFFSQHKKMGILAIILFTLLSAPFILVNGSKPIITEIHLPNNAMLKLRGKDILSASRDEKYFYNRPGAAIPMSLSSKVILDSGCREVALHIGEDTWEYPFWVFLSRDPKPLRIEHVFVQNTSHALPYPLGPFHPCVIISNDRVNALNLNGEPYLLLGTTGQFSVYFSQEFIQSYNAQRGL